MCAHTYMNTHEDENTLSINGDAYAPRYKIYQSTSHVPINTHIYRKRLTRW